MYNEYCQNYSHVRIPIFIFAHSGWQMRHYDTLSIVIGKLFYVNGRPVANCSRKMYGN